MSPVSTLQTVCEKLRTNRVILIYIAVIVSIILAFTIEAR